MTHVEKQHQATAKKIQTALEKSAVDSKKMGVLDVFADLALIATYRVAMCFATNTTRPMV